ncbi:MAG: response regulator transcription factor [Bacteroidota bacterium]
MNRILVIEDNRNFGYILKEYLSMNDFKVSLANSGEIGLQLLEKERFDICLLDIMLPRQDGFEVAKALRKIEPDLPFIFLTAKALKVDKLKGFRLGCDDYIVKPIDEELLLARIQAIISRTSKNTESTDKITNYQIGKYVFNFAQQELLLEGEKQFLTEREANLLQLLCINKNALLERKKALKEIWGNNDEFNRKSMDVFIFRLRKYLSSDENIRIRNVHGRGFVLEEI